MQHQTEIKARCKIDPAGRILIPADVRQQLNIGPGDEVFLEVHDGQMTVSTFQAVLREIQHEIGQLDRPVWFTLCTLVATWGLLNRGSSMEAG